jgi:hypothetical protein
VKPYVIATPRAEPTSAGISALHQLHHDLKRAGCKSRLVLDPVEGDGQFARSDEIVIYPDCYNGNVLGADCVVRYILMYVGYFAGTDTDFPLTEMMYYYSRDFVHRGREPENILAVPMIREHRFPYRPPSERKGSCYLAIKYGRIPDDLPAGAIAVTKEIDLEELFSKIHTLHTYDNSAINIEAGLAGIQVVPHFNEKTPQLFDLDGYWDWDNIAGSYREMKRRYQLVQLPDFIRRTQARYT